VSVLAYAAPLAPAAGLSGALILLLFVTLFLIALLYTWDYTFGAFLRRLAEMVDDIWLVGGKLADAFLSSDHWVQAQIAKGIVATEQATARTWGALTWVARETGDAMVAFGSDVYAAIAGLVDGEIPAQVGAATKPIDTRLDQVNRRTSSQARAEAQARSRGIDAVGRDLTAEARTRSRGIDAVNERITSVVMPRIRALDQGLADVWGFTRRNLRVRIGRLEALLAAGTIGAVAVAALTRVFPYWQCSNVRGFNRALCRMGVPYLNGLLGLIAGTALLALALDPRPLAKAAGTITEALEGIIRETAIR